MNARDKLNIWNIAAAILAAIVIASLLSSSLVFWLVLAITIWIAVNQRGIR